MPILHTLLPTPSNRDEQVDPEPLDHNERVDDPAHASYLEEQLWTPGIAEHVYQIANFLAEERGAGYNITPPIWPEDPTEDTRDWGVWAFHGSLIYDYYED